MRPSATCRRAVEHRAGTHTSANCVAFLGASLSEHGQTEESHQRRADEAHKDENPGVELMCREEPVTHHPPEHRQWDSQENRADQDEKQEQALQRQPPPTIHASVPQARLVADTRAVTNCIAAQTSMRRATAPARPRAFFAPAWCVRSRWRAPIRTPTSRLRREPASATGT